jgi:prevent-host-death family protein
MIEDSISIGEVKRDISQLVNRVAYGGDRIVLTSRGKPKAVLISIADYELLKQQEAGTPLAYWSEWTQRAEVLSRVIQERRGGEYITLEMLDQLEQAEEQDLEKRDDEHSAA